jgi:hypothetical protein
MQMMQEMLQRVGQSMEATELRIKEQEASIKAYDAETKRIGAVQSGLNEDQVQDIIMGTLAGMMTSNDLVGTMSPRDSFTEPEVSQVPPQ